MAVKSAKSGTVAFGAGPTLVADITNISINETAAPNPYASSSTSGEMRRVMGIGDITGSFDILVDAIPAGIAPGTSVALVIKSDGSTTMFTDTAYINDVSYGVPVGSGGIITATVTFGRNG
jgi:hypothetical protein